MYHVKAVSYAVPGNLDLNIADEEEFSPDKLRANLERLYTTVIVGVLGLVKHIARLRSWRETRRTACFCAVSTASRNIITESRADMYRHTSLPGCSTSSSPCLRRLL